MNTKHKHKLNVLYANYIYSLLHTQLLYKKYTAAKVAAKRAPKDKPSGHETFP